MLRITVINNKDLPGNEKENFSLSGVHVLVGKAHTLD